MPVRLARTDELPQVTAMMQALWPDAGEYDFGDETIFVWDRGRDTTLRVQYFRKRLRK